LIQRLNARQKASRIVEVGCGLGDFTARIASSGVEAIGIDTSATAINKAITRHGGSSSAKFMVGNFEDFDLLRRLNPNVIVMSEVTWYVLQHLHNFKHFLANVIPDC